MPQDNYQLQAQQAKAHFLHYDQQQLVRKLHLQQDADYLYTHLFSIPYRIHRRTGDLQRLEKGDWVAAESYEEIMTLLDLVCDSRPDRSVSGRWISAQNLGRMFHRTLLERPSPLAMRIHENPELFHKACACLCACPFPGGDIGYQIPFFDGLSIALQFWFGDEEFPPKLYLLWDENTLQYLRYETTWFATTLLLRRINRLMDSLA